MINFYLLFFLSLSLQINKFFSLFFSKIWVCKLVRLILNNRKWLFKVDILALAFILRYLYRWIILKQRLKEIFIRSSKWLRRMRALHRIFRVLWIRIMKVFFFIKVCLRRDIIVEILSFIFDKFSSHFKFNKIKWKFF